MDDGLVGRRALALSLVSLGAGVGFGARVRGAPSGTQNQKSTALDGLTHSAESIRQEVVFEAEPSRVFEALLNTGQFDAITRLSDAVALVTAANAKPTAINPDVGGAFTLFGGYVTGRQVEVVPGERLVQVWRAASWPAGDHSIAKFVLVADGAKTRMVFEHLGFPQGEGRHLAPGWKSHYWVPLAKYLSQP